MNKKRHKFCEATFISTGHLKVHTRNHTGESCELSFSQTGGLQRHNRTHTGEKPYKCDICDDSFRTILMKRPHKITGNGLVIFVIQFSVRIVT